MNLKINDEILLKKLAILIIDFPRYTIKELAEASGISKASLYRICGTREQLEELLSEEAKKCIESIIQTSSEQHDDYVDGIRTLIAIHLENKEFLAYAQRTQLCANNSYQERYLAAMDTFFLEGKKKSFFNMDYDPATLTEIFIAIFAGIIDAERRGRIASAMMNKVFFNIFLNGTVFLE